MEKYNSQITRKTTDKINLSSIRTKARKSLFIDMLYTNRHVLGSDFLLLDTFIFNKELR